jgi:hypothetical protein
MWTDFSGRTFLHGGSLLADDVVRVHCDMKDRSVSDILVSGTEFSHRECVLPT